MKTYDIQNIDSRIRF